MQQPAAAKPLPIQIQKLTNKKDPILKTSQKPVDPETYHRKLDDKLAKINFDDITVAELKETLRERGLSATGRKAELMTRLKDEYDLVITQNNTHVMLNRRIASMSLEQKKSPKTAYAPYFTPPLRHSSPALNQLKSPQLAERLTSSVPEISYLNDQFMNLKPSCLRESLDMNEEPSETLKGKESCLTNEVTQLYIDWQDMSQDVANVQPNVQYAPMKLEENVDVWDDRMLQNFLNHI
jgi:hypothetical protein